MPTFRNAIHTKTWACHIIDLETANLSEYDVTWLFGWEANNGSIDLNTKENAWIARDEAKAEFIKQVNEEVINKAIEKNPNNK